MTTYVRTNGGRTVHLASCRYAVNTWDWNWAEGKPLEEIRADLRVLRLHGIVNWCKRCFPQERAS